MKKAFALLLISFHVCAFAGFDEGLSAYNSGDFSEAMRNWQPLAEHGDANAQFNLGLLYENGRGVALDENLAFYWYRKAAGQGHVDAQNNLGSLYYRGQGVRQDYEQAVYWYRKAAERGSASAQFNVGVMYGAGQGVAQSDELAAQWYQRAAEQGNAKARQRLERLYAAGCGVAQDAPDIALGHREALESGLAQRQATRSGPANCHAVANFKDAGRAMGAPKPLTAAMRQITATQILIQ